MSVRPPEYQVSYDSVHTVFGDFLQLVTQSMIDSIRPLAEDYVEVVTSRGMPQELFSRFSGEKTNITKRADLGGNKKDVNDYYPSSQMHMDTFRKVLPACESLFKS
jgi:hypothetical protein